MTSLIKTVFQRFNAIRSSERTLRNIFRKTDINLVCDVGAGCGDYASELRQWGYEGWIASFEASAEKFRVLQADRMHDPRWTGFNMLVTAKSFRHPQFIATGHHASCPKSGTLAEVVDTLRHYVPSPNICLKISAGHSVADVLKGTLPLLKQVRALQLTPKSCGEAIRCLRKFRIEATCHLPPSEGHGFDKAFACLTLQARPAVPRIKLPARIEPLNKGRRVTLPRKT